jgi:hypothetical protein
MALDSRYMEADGLDAKLALERRHGADVVEHQAQIQKGNMALADALNKQNTLDQFHAALGRIGAISARAHTGSSGQNWQHYCHSYERLLYLAQSVVALGETVRIPARLAPQGAAEMVTLSPKGAT